MAGIVGRKEVNDGLQSWLFGLEKQMKSDVDEVALEAGVRGQKMMEHVIDTTESALRPGKDNRNWTFEMRNSMDAKVDKRGTTVSIRLGWLDNKEGYFLLQDYGGKLGDREIPAMHSLEKGFNEMIATLARKGLKVQ